MIKILIADDIPTNRILLSQTLKAVGDFEIVEAVDGEEAISVFIKEQPDLILMDIMMPGIDGREATTKIKSIMGDDHVPIIFLTALSSEDSLATALESGGDDFISKPFAIDILISKINAHLRIRELTKQLNEKNTSLTNLNQHLENEQILIEHFFEGAIKQSFLDEKIIKYHMSSLAAFNGDLLLVERGSKGSFYVVMGDFTGHGLTAAMGTLPVAMTFFSMVEKNYSVGEIAREINHQLYKLMPNSMFFAANILEVNVYDGVLSVWAGGMPENYVFNKDNSLKQTIHSQHMPLGILDDDEFDSLTQVFNIIAEDKIYLYSDGITEAKNSQDELFGDNRLKDVLLKSGAERFESLLTDLNAFTGKGKQKDDITLVELNCQTIPELTNTKDKNIEESLDWNISISIHERDMKSPNPISKLFDILSSLPFITQYKDVLHVLIFEIYNNALEHSILNLQSIDKTDSEKFSEYYESRNKKINELEQATIDFNFNFIVKNDTRFLEISVKDSGSGYQTNATSASDDLLHGRGLDIIRSFCEETAFSDDGKILTLLYRL